MGAMYGLKIVAILAQGELHMVVACWIVVVPAKVSIGHSLCGARMVWVLFGCWFQVCLLCDTVFMSAI
jgi:hypothetical protein